MSATFLVFFRSGACDLDSAAARLERKGFKAHLDEGTMIVEAADDGPSFRIGLSSEPWVQAEAAEIGEGTPKAAALAGCDARFEVEVDDLDAALGEMNGMMMIQETLQAMSEGYLFLTWNGSLTGPDGE